MSRAQDQTVVVVRAELAPAIHERFEFDRSVKVFAATEAPKALASLLKKPQSVVALDRRFVTSPRGARFITEVRASHPDLEVRILTDEGAEVPLVLRRPVQTTGRATVAAASELLVGDARRAPRFPVRPGSEASINGERTALVDISVAGAQVLSPVILRPTQAVRVALTDDAAPITIEAAVVWSMFERSRKTGQLQYRAGMEFTNPEPMSLEGYCSRYGVDV